MDGLKIKPIGKVSSEFKRPEELHFACEEGLNAKNTSRIILNDGFKEGLKGLENFSHAFILYYLHRADRVELTTHPGPPSINVPRTGVFASRSQYRPNHLALRLVKINEIDGNSLTVTGLDAIDGSAVLDIKPYIPGFDRPEKFRVEPQYNWFEC